MADQTQKSTLQEILAHLPGLKGETALESRRDADRKVRELITGALKDARTAVEGALGDKARAGDLAGLSPLQSLSDRLARLIAQFAHADSGAGNFLDATQVSKDRLEQVYEVDIEVAQTVQGALEKARSLADGAGSTAKDVTQALDAVAQAFERRQKILKGVA